MTFLIEKSNQKGVDIINNVEEITEQDLFKILLQSPIINDVYQLPASFDIEASSYLKNGEKRAVMYIWQMSFFVPNWNILYVYGRTWSEWELFIYKLRKMMKLEKYKLIIYVHNLSYEFQWICTHLFFTKIFARKKRHPIYVEINHLIFKCSYFLSNYSLRNLAKERGYTLKEDMDYSLKRLPCTKLDNDDLTYALTDVKIIVEYIADEIKRNGRIQDIPLTSTGYARRYCLNFITEHENINAYQNWLKKILPTEPELFKLLFQGYTGAFTHSNFDHTHITLEDVHCIDYTSSYPAVMCRKRFPMCFHKGNPEKLRFYDGKAKIMKITYNQIQATTNHSIISRHKCVIEDDPEFSTIVDNGRVRRANKLTTVITDLDFEIYEKFYSYKSFQIETIYIADYKYLPKNLILSILHLYANKTTLKGVIGKEEAYLRAKELINAIYGMSVTNPVNDEIEYEVNYHEWKNIEANIDEGLKKYASSKRIFTAYQWGVWVTAWARWELLNTLYAFGNDGIYCDTDSIKYLNNHDDIIEADNARILKENNEIIHYYDLDPNLFCPKTIKGVEKPLGVWDRDPDYKYFKTLGAKRYCYQYTDEYFEKKKEDLKTNYNFFITVAGLSKINGKSSIIRKAIKHNQSPFDIFSYSNPEISPNYVLEIPTDESGKQCFSYQIETFSEEETDYQNNKTLVHETSFVYNESIPFAFSVTEDYATLLGLTNIETNQTGSFKQSRLNINKGENK